MKAGDTVAARSGSLRPVFVGGLRSGTAGLSWLRERTGGPVTCTNSSGGDVAADIGICKIYGNQLAKHVVARKESEGI